MRKDSNILMIAAILALFFALLLSGCQKAAQVGATEDEQKRVKVMAAEEKSIGSALLLPAEVQPSLKADVIAEVSGTVAEQGVAVGNRVAKNQMLLILNREEMVLALERAEISLERAKLQLAKAKSDQALQESNAENRYNKAKSHYAATQREHDRLKTLHENGAIALADMERITDMLEQARWDMTLAQEQLQSAKQPEHLGLLEVQAKEADLAYREAQKQLNKMSIKAPIDGVIVEVLANVGQQVNPGQALVRVEQHQPLLLRVSLTEQDVVALQGRETVEVYFPLLDRHLPAAIKSIAPSASRNGGGFPMELEIENEDLALKPGMSAQAVMDESQARPVLAIPQNAVMKNNGHSFIYVVEAGVAHKRIVELGRSFKNEVEVIAGLQVGEKVVIVGQGLLEGDQVPVTEVDL